LYLHQGAIAQLGEHLPCTQGVVGSIPSGSIKVVLKVISLGCEKKLKKVEDNAFQSIEKVLSSALLSETESSLKIWLK
jgi:hypothetical protein